MLLVDFVYDGLRLSDFGCMVGSAVTGNNDSVEMGSVIKLETNVNHGSYVSEIINADYPDVYSVTFDIFRTPCGKGFKDHFEDKEITWFMRWLNRKDYHKFIPIYDNPKDFYRMFYMGTFTECKAISIQGQVYGFTLTFTSNSPFGYLDYKPNTFNVVKDGSTFNVVDPYSGTSTTYTGGILTIFDESEELGFVYPKSFKITLSSSLGDGNKLVIWNAFDKDANNRNTRYTEVRNCKANETITFDCIHKIISSNKEDMHTKFYNDFNYVFPRLNNEFYDRKNQFYINQNCTVTIEYNPIRKVGVIA